MIPSHSSPLSVGVFESVISVGFVVSVEGSLEGSEVSSAITGEDMMVKPIKIRVKNNLTIFLIISNYIILCVKIQEVV